MKDMLRCYAIYCTGVYVYQTISREKLGVVREFLQDFGDRGYRLTVCGASTVEDFLGFIGTPDRQIRAVLARIPLIKGNRPGQ
jgi:hypothetical protein